MNTTVKSYIASVIMEQIQNAENSKNIISEHNYRNLLNTVNFFSEEQAKAFLMGMELQKDLPVTKTFGTF